MGITFQVLPPAAGEYLALFETTGWNQEYHLTADDLARTIAASQFKVSAYDGERLVGFGRLLSDGVMHAMIYEMIIHPGYQGRGIGSEILRRLVEWCRENGVREAQLFCARGKRGFYEKNGFVARAEDAPGMQMILGPGG